MKRIVSLMLAIIMVVAWFPKDVYAVVDTSDITTPAIVVDSKYAAPGMSVEVDLLLVNNPGVSGAKVTVSYDSNLILTDAISGEAFAALDYTKPGNYNSPCGFTWDSENAEVLEDGVVLTLIFDVSESAQPNQKLNINLSYRYGDIYDNDLNSVAFEMVSGFVSIIDYVPGDVNGDGMVNGKDITLVRRYYAGGYDTVINEAAADVNDDGVINGKDITLMRRYNAGGYEGIVLLPSTKWCNHSMEYNGAIEASCTESGSVAYWHCVVCQKYFYDKDGVTEINPSDIIIEALGHTEVIDKAVAPTYTSTGLTEGSHCSTCNKVLSAQQVIPALKKTEYAVTYHIANNDTYLAGVDIKNPNPPYYTTEDGLELQDLIVKGYNFKGWYTAQTGGTKVTEISVGTTGNKVLYAQWEKVTYTVTFDSPDVPWASITYTVDTGVTLTNPAWFGYTFVGWSLDGKIISSIKPGTTGNITLHANWTSNRNRASAKSSFADPIIIEDMPSGRYLFVYEIGTIENVPLSVIEYIGNSQGITIDKQYEYSKSVQEGFADTIAKAVSNATTKTSAWTLSEDWNASASATNEHDEEVGKTDEITDSQGNTSQGKYYISNVEGGATATSASAGGSSGTSSKVTEGNSTGINGSYSKENQESTSNEHSVNVSVGAKGNIGPVELSGGIEYNYDHTTTNSEKEAFALAKSRTDSAGTEDTSSSEAHWDSSSTESSSWNSEEGYEIGASVSKNTSVSNTISQAIHDRYAYTSMEERGGSNSSTHSTDETQELSNEYASTVEYSTEVSETVRKSIKYSSNATGYYRLVAAGTVHVFAVVGYDIATNSYFTYTYNVLDKERHEYLDYSKDNANFNDCENAILPFEIPYEVHEITSSIIAKSNGIVVDTENGIITEYNGDAEFVLIPEYISVNNGDGTRSAIRIRGIDADAFKGNTSIKGISLPKYVTAIPDAAFEGCTSLETIMGYGIKEIGKKAFKGCSNLKSFSLDQYITSLGENAFQDAPEISVMAANENVAKAVLSSGAKRITLNLSAMEENLHDIKIEIPESTVYFALIGNGSVYNNVQVESSANETFISNMNFEDNTDTPLLLNSEIVTLSRVTVKGCPGFALILPTEMTKVNLYGTVELSSKGDSAAISRSVILQKANAEVAGKLKLTGDYMLCGEMSNQSMLAFVEGELIVISEDVFSSMLTSSIVTFDANGGAVSEGTKTVYYGQYYGTMPTPTRDYYSFAGWYTEENGGVQVTETTIVTVLANQTLYAHWVRDSYTIVFDANGGSVNETSRTVLCGDAIGSLPTPSRTGYAFEGWFTADGRQITENTALEAVGDVKLIAKWTIIKYKATWNTGTGYSITVKRTSSPIAGATTGTLSNGSNVYYGDVLSITYSASTGYTITGKGVTSVTVSGNVTPSQIYATAKVNSYTASWSGGTGYSISVKRTSSPNAGASTGTLSSGATIYYGDVLSISYSANSGYSLASKGQTSITVTGNVGSSQIYASASPNSYTYNIVYKSSNGTSLGSSAATYKYGTTNTISAPAKSGYNTPSAQSVKWDSTSAKTITFTYTPTAVSAQTIKSGTWVSWSSGKHGISYNVRVEYGTRTSTGVQMRIVWTNTVFTTSYLYYGHAQKYTASIGGQSTGSVQITTVSTWASTTYNGASSTGTSGWITVPVSATSTSTSVSLSWSDTDGVSGSWSGTVAVPTY